MKALLGYFLSASVLIGGWGIIGCTEPDSPKDNIGLVGPANNKAENPTGFQSGRAAAKTASTTWHTNIAAAGSSEISGWPASNAKDGNNNTSYSSALHSSSNSPEFLAFWYNNYNLTLTNFIHLVPRWANNHQYCFPYTFTISYSDPNKWVPLGTFTGYDNVPQDIYLPLGKAVMANGLRIDASVLGSDGSSYALQMAEVQAGYDPAYDHIKLTQNLGPAGVPQIENMGAGPYDPNKLKNWVRDIKEPFITGYNVYAPSVVKDGSAWNIYFGGWHSIADANWDRIYVTRISDNFTSTPGPATEIISPVPPSGQGSYYSMLNNPNVLKMQDNTWRMVFTAAYIRYARSPNTPNCTNLGPNIECGNLTAGDTSTDGMNWGGNPYRLNGIDQGMVNIYSYPAPGSLGSEINGGNVLFYDGANKNYVLFFTDFSTKPGIPDPGLIPKFATSVPGNWTSFTYRGVVNNSPGIVNDMRYFKNASQKYLMATHINQQAVYYLISDHFQSFPGSRQTLFSGASYEPHITGVGLVADDNTLYGALYGADQQSNYEGNMIYARWLQRKATFTEVVNKTIYSTDRANGPSISILRGFPTATFLTGSLTITETDNQTMVTIPNITIGTKDRWSFVP